VADKRAIDALKRLHRLKLYYFFGFASGKTPAASSRAHLTFLQRLINTGLQPGGEPAKVAKAVLTAWPGRLAVARETVETVSVHSRSPTPG
jgi:hypothetical protein